MLVIGRSSIHPEPELQGTQWNKRRVCVCDGAAEMVPAAFPAAEALTANPRVHGSEGSLNVQLYLYERIMELLAAFEASRFTAYCIPYRKFTLSAQLMAT